MTIEIKEKGAVLQPEDAANILKKVLAAEQPIDQDKEHFWIFGLNSQNLVQYLELVSLGTLNASLVHPREVFRLAVMKGIAQIIMAHNHPSGDPEPSRDDLLITKRLVEAGKILGIEVTDHVVIGGPKDQNPAMSFKEKNLL